MKSDHFDIFAEIGLDDTFVILTQPLLEVNGRIQVVSAVCNHHKRQRLLRGQQYGCYVHKATNPSSEKKTVNKFAMNTV